MDCVTGSMAWHTVKNWGSKETAIRSSSGPLCDCRGTIWLSIVYWTDKLLFFQLEMMLILSHRLASGGVHHL